MHTEYVETMTVVFPLKIACCLILFQANWATQNIWVIHVSLLVSV